MFIIAENSDKIKTLKRPLDLLSWTSLKILTKALWMERWEQKPDGNEEMGEEEVAMGPVNNLWGYLAVKRGEGG